MGEKKHNEPRGLAFVKTELREMFRRGMPKKGKRKTEVYPGDRLPERWRLYILYLLLCVDQLMGGKPWPPDPFGLIPKMHSQGKYSKRGRPRVNPEEPEDVPLTPLDELQRLMGGEDNVDADTLDQQGSG